MRKIMLMMFVAILLISSVSAFEFDNVKSFQKKQGDKYGEITVKNLFGLGGDISKYKLENNTDYCLTECEATGTTNLYKPSTLFNSLEFKNYKGKQTEIKESKLYYASELKSYYEDVLPELVLECSQVNAKNGSWQDCKYTQPPAQQVLKQSPNWIEYNLGQVLPKGDYYWKIVGNKRAYETVDWIGSSEGISFDEWAYWLGITPTNYWKFNETSGTNAVEFVNGTLNMTATNSANIIDGKLGKGRNATYYGGVFQSHTSPASTNWAFGTGALSMCAWFNVPPAGAGGSRIYVDNFGNGGWANNNGWAFNINGGGNIQITGNGADLSVTSGAGMNDATWHYACWTRTGNSNALYKDGVNIKNFTNQNDFDTNAIIKINGNGAGGGDTTAMKGSIDNFIIYKAVTLTPADILAEYNSGTGREADMAPADVFGDFNVTLLTPTNNTLSSSSSFEFNATLHPSSNNVTNATLYIWNMTDNAIYKTSENLTIFPYTSAVNVSLNASGVGEGNYFWNVYGCGIDNIGARNCSFAPYNFTLKIDSTTPVVSIINPNVSIPLGSIALNLTLNYSATDTNLQACWFNYALVNYTLNCAKNSTFVILGSNYSALTIYANDSAGTVGSALHNLNFSLFQNSLAYNTTQYETGIETLSINVTSMTSANLFYNNTKYTGSVTNGTATATIDVPNTGQGVLNKTFYWNLNGGVNTSNYTIPINKTIFDLCNATYPNMYLNISFADESNLTTMDASIPTSSFIYTLGSTIFNKTTTVISTTNNLTYTFCGSPNDIPFSVTPTVQYKKGTAYPQRIWSPSTQTYTNITTNQTLYLLSTSAGDLVTFQVINPASQTLSGVSVNVTRVIGGVTTLIADSETDSAGTVTFWLDPDFVHTFTFVKSGFSPYITSFAPTVPPYTITLGEASTASNYSVEGININILPAESYLLNDTTYIFGFNLTSSYASITSYGFNIRLANDTIVGGGSTSTTGTLLTSTYNVNNQSIIYIDAYWISNNFTTNFSDNWVVQNTEYTQWSINSFITDLKLYLDYKPFGLDDFGRMLFIFIIMFSIAGFTSYKYGLTSPFATMMIIFFTIFFFDVVVGLIPTIRGMPYLLTYASGILLIIAFFKEVQT